MISIRKISLTGLCLAAFAMAACTPTKLPEPVTKGLHALKADAMGSKAAFENMNKALKKLRDSKDSDIKANFEYFSAEATALREKTGGTRTMATIAETRAEDYFKKWEQQLQTIQDDDLRAGGEQRRLAAEASYNEFRKDLTELRVAFGKYAAGVNDVEKVLAADVTPAGLKTVRPKIDSLLGMDFELNMKFDKAVSSLDRIAK